MVRSWWRSRSPLYSRITCFSESCAGACNQNASKRTNQRACNESDGSRFGVQFFPNRADFDVLCKSFQAPHPTSHFRCVGVKDSNVSMCRSWRAIFSASDFSLPSATAVQSKYMVFVANDGFFSFLNDISSPKDYLGTSKQIKWQPHLSQSYRLNSWTSHCQDTTSCWIFQSVMVKRKTLNPQNRKEKISTRMYVGCRFLNTI